MRKTLSLWVDWTRSGVKFFVCLLLVLFFIKWQNLFTGWCTLECVHAVADIWLMNCLINANFIEFDGVNNFIDLKMTITIFDSSTRLTSESIVLAACTSRDNLVFWLDFFAAESHLKWFLSTLWSPSHHANRFTNFLSLKCRSPSNRYCLTYVFLPPDESAAEMLSQLAPSRIMHEQDFNLLQCWNVYVLAWSWWLWWKLTFTKCSPPSDSNIILTSQQKCREFGLKLFILIMLAILRPAFAFLITFEKSFSRGFSSRKRRRRIERETAKVSHRNQSFLIKFQNVIQSGESLSAFSWLRYEKRNFVIKRLVDGGKNN